MSLEDLPEECSAKIDDFKQQNEKFLKNRLIRSFFQNEDNYDLLLKAICHPLEDNLKELDLKFKKYYFSVRFTSFISTTLYFTAINFDKKRRKTSERNPLTLDQSITSDGDTTFKDLLIDPKSEVFIDHLLDGDKIEEYIEDPILHKAVLTLTPKQKEVVNFAYLKGLSDTEIATILNKTQQAVSKVHKKALEKMGSFLRENTDVESI